MTELAILGDTACFKIMPCKNCLQF